MKEPRHLLFFLIALFTGVLILSLDIFSFGVILVLALAACIFLAPDYFILFWIIFAAVSNKIVFSRYGITSYGLMNILFLPLLALKVFSSYKREFVTFPLRRVYLLFLGVLFAAIWYSSVPYSMGVRKYCNFIIPLLLSVMMISVIKDETSLRRYLLITLVSVCVLGVLGTVMYYLRKWVVYVEVPRATGVLGWPNDYALFLNINLAVSLALAATIKRAREQVLGAFIGLVLVLSLIPTFSKSGYAGALLIFAIVYALASIKNKTIKPLIVGVCALFVVGVVALIKFYPFLYHRVRDTSSFESRIAIWQSVFHKFFEHPFIGSGFLSSAEMVHYLSPYKELHSTHNLYLQLLLESGAIGLVMFVLFFICAIGYAYNILLRSRQPYSIALAIGFMALALCILVYSFVGNAFLTPMVNLYFWFYFSFLVSAHRIEDQK